MAAEMVFTNGIEMENKSTDGILLRADLQEYITESFAKRYNVNLENWIEPYAYWDQMNSSVLSTRDYVPDGTYVVFGKVVYPGKERMSYHHIFQFNIIKLSGANARIAAQFNDYPNMPANLPLEPIFPMFKVDQRQAYPSAKKIFESKLQKPMHVRQLENLIDGSKVNSLENKLYRLRYAVQLEIDKYKK
jgi:hypothetical protein